MGRLKVTYTDINGTRRVIDDVDAGQSLMEVAKENRVAGISGDCGGGCSCATCHVYVDPAWWEQVGKPEGLEDAMLNLTFSARRENSRLSCQIEMTESLDGIEVTVAPSARS